MAAAANFPWLRASAVVAILAVAAAALLRLPAAAPDSPARPNLPPVRVTKLGPAGSSVLLAEKLELDDPTLLFMPAPVDRGEAVLPGARRPEAGVPAATVPDKKLFFSAESLAAKNAAGDLAVQFSEPVPAPKNPTGGLKLTDRTDVPLTLGRTDDKTAQPPARAGWVEAVAAGSGQVVWAGALGGAEVAPSGDWDPLELLGAVAPAGLVGDLVVTRSSGSDTVDSQIRLLLAQTLRVGERLPPGLYTFRVGP
jgi:hypothetical protein